MKANQKIIAIVNHMAFTPPSHILLTQVKSVTYSSTCSAGQIFNLFLAVTQWNSGAGYFTAG